jgi:flagellin
MSSILTNMSAMSAVANLAATQKNLANTENQIATGLKVSSAKDNAAYWSIATSMKTTTGELSAVSDSLNLGSSVVGTATAALNTTISIMQKMAQDLVSAQQASVDPTKVETDIAALQSQLRTTVSSASFNGVNLLDQGCLSVSQQSVVSSVSGAGSTFAVNTIKISYSDTALTTSGAATGSKTGILDAIGSQSGQTVMDFAISPTTTPDQLTALSRDLDTALLKVQTAAAKLGATQTAIDLQSTFVSALSDSITTGVGSLVDADMNQASTRLNALQTQQQLGIQALSVSNQNSQIILKLFGG